MFHDKVAKDYTIGATSETERDANGVASVESRKQWYWVVHDSKNRERIGCCEDLWGVEEGFGSWEVSIDVIQFFHGLYSECNFDLELVIYILSHYFQTHTSPNLSTLPGTSPSSPTKSASSTASLSPPSPTSSYSFKAKGLLISNYLHLLWLLALLSFCWTCLCICSWSQ